MNSRELLPQSQEAERGVLSAMLQGGVEAIEIATAEVTSEHFSLPANALIFAAIVQLHGEGRPTDFITLTQHLRDTRRLGELGENGAAYVTQVFNELPTCALLRTHLGILREKQTLRRIIAFAQSFGRRCYEEQDNVKALLEEFLAGAVEIGSTTGDADALRRVTPGEVAERLGVLEQRYNQRGRLGGLASGIADLDRTIDGFKGKHVYVFAGRPAMGKSAFGVECAEHICIGAAERVPVAIFSLEMPREQLIDRILLKRAEIELGRLRDGFMSEADFPRLTKSAQEIIGGHLYIDETPGLTIAQFRSRARRAVLKHGVKLIVIDYVQIMKGSSRRGQDNRALELQEIMQGIRETAKTLDVPVIVLAQINRTAEERSQARPTLADLKESGAIEEEANVVGILYRPGYYAKTDEQKKKLAEKHKITIDERGAWEAELERLAELDIAKHRNGGVGTIKLRFDGKFTRFTGVTTKVWSNAEEERQDLA